MVRILNEKILSSGFNLLKEYDLEVPSLKENIEYAAPMNREVVHTQDSVVVLLYAPDQDGFLFCEQFRTGPYFNGEDNPFILEAPAGMIDYGLSPEETAIKEVEEETGITLKDIHQIAAVYSSSGRITEKCFIYYAEIPGNPATGLFGIAHEGEEIKTHCLPRKEVYSLLDSHKLYHAQTVLALNWFKANKDPDQPA
ncbi:MAG: NUDIX domain-containing protein [Pseudomonadota bacterium]